MRVREKSKSSLGPASLLRSNPHYSDSHVSVCELIMVKSTLQRQSRSGQELIMVKSTLQRQSRSGQELIKVKSTLQRQSRSGLRAY
jgi:hypothetical protein